MQTAKFMVTGLDGAGKTTFIQSVTDPLPNTPEAGSMVISDDLRIELHGAPAPPHSDAWRDTIERVIGIVLVVDSTQPEAFPQVSDLIGTFQATRPCPIIIALNKQDLDTAHSTTDLRHHLPENTLINVFPCIATDSQSVQNVLLTLIFEILS